MKTQRVTKSAGSLTSILFLLTSACSITKPCTEGGDVSWNPKIVGDKRCAQKDFPGKRTLNHGPFTQAYQSTGRIALEGEFDEGRKQGIWKYYGEDGQLKSVKYFDRGVEKTPPAEVQKEINLIIQQKAGTR